jgi:hypothetical protein
MWEYDNDTIKSEALFNDQFLESIDKDILVDTFKSTLQLLHSEDLIMDQACNVIESNPYIMSSMLYKNVITIFFNNSNYTFHKPYAFVKVMIDQLKNTKDKIDNLKNLINRDLINKDEKKVQ